MKIDGNNSKPASKALADTTTIPTRTTVTTQGPAATRVTNTYPQALVKKKSCTTLVCELMRLKTQQKYLECSQVKLNPANYEDLMVNAINNSNSTASPLPLIAGEARQLVNEIECVKIQLEEDLKSYRESLYREVQELREMVNGIREDVQQPERLSQYSLPVLRERIITINTQLMQLCDKNQSEIGKLRDECEQLERNNDVIVKI